MEGYLEAFIATTAIFSCVMLFIAIQGVFVREKEYASLDDQEDCQRLSALIDVEVAKLEQCRAELAAREKAERNRREFAAWEAQQRTAALASRKARVTELENSLFAEWRRYKARVDFDGSTPDAQLLPGFWRELPSFPVMRSPDVGLLRESQTPYLKTVLGDYWNRLPAPPKLIG